MAGLFILVEALGRTGVIQGLAAALSDFADAPRLATLVSGGLLAFASNLMSNLPAGLIAGAVVAQARPHHMIVDGLLIGVDLGPNLSVTGSLATIVWLQAIRREGEDVSFLRFLKVGILVMLLALAAALGARLLLV